MNDWVEEEKELGLLTPYDGLVFKTKIKLNLHEGNIVVPNAYGLWAHLIQQSMRAHTHLPRPFHFQPVGLVLDVIFLSFLTQGSAG